MARDAGNHPIPALRPGAVTQSVAYTGTAGVITNPVSSTVVRVYCTSDAFIAIGTTPVATTAWTPVTAKVPEYFRVIPGVDKVSAIQSSAGGTLYVTDMN